MIDVGQIMGSIRKTIFGNPMLREYEELMDSRPEAAEAIARDIGVVPSNLARLMAADREASKLYRPMMETLGLSPDAASRSQRTQLREIQITCSLCTTKRRCRKELAAHTAGQNLDAFCPNAVDLRRMAAERTWSTT